jgi:hypothetical protein
LSFVTRNVVARVVSLLSFLLCFGVPSTAAPSDLWIALFPSEAEPALRNSSVPIWTREEGAVIAGASEAQLDGLRAQGIEPLFSTRDHGESIYVLSHDRFFIPPALPGLLRFRIDDGSMLYLIPAGLEMSLPQLKPRAMFHGVPRVALPPVRVHPADKAAAPPSPVPNELVQQIVDATRQESWFRYVRDLSGDSDVTIPGYCADCRIRTRASDYMFPPNNTGDPPGNPFATEYLEDKGAGWGFTGPNAVRESYTAAESGCTVRQGSQTWQNLIFTLPAQVDYAQSQQVIFIVHYDSISETPATDANNAPGADDAMSGGAALLEAMRLFKDYAWLWRVLNMDLTAFDGNKDGVMNLYNWSTTKCPGCVAFGDAFIQANSDYGDIIDPVKILRNTSRMCGSDHCPFWNVGVTAIDLNEDLTNLDFCPCFDRSQSSDCRDTVTQTYFPGSGTLMFDQDYSWPTEKAAIALLAHTAEPLYACPAKGAKLNATVGRKQVQLQWPKVPRVTHSVVERAEGGCRGTFAGIASTARSVYTDTGVTAGSTYGYRIRTCPFQVSNCVERRVGPR